jgi:hypothetical protein
MATSNVQQSTIKIDCRRFAGSMECGSGEVADGFNFAPWPSW